MMNNTDFSRRTLVKSTLLGALAVSTPNLLFAHPKRIGTSAVSQDPGELFYRYPAIDDETASEVVGKSHSNFERVKELVSKRPELARATWDWGFGDWESALGAASHVGRRDIAQLLMEYGARPDIFTYAMLGELEVVKAMVEATPGVQSISGPHGITLLQHARVGLRMDTMTETERGKVKKVIGYLEELGDADIMPNSIDLTEDQMGQYIGEYRFGDGERDIFFASLNMRKTLNFGRKGTFGTGIYLKEDGSFGAYAAPSLSIRFEMVDNLANELTFEEPGLILKASRVA